MKHFKAGFLALALLVWGIAPASAALAVVQTIYASLGNSPSLSLSTSPAATTTGNLVYFQVDIVYPGAAGTNADVQTPQDTAGNTWVSCQTGYGSNGAGGGNSSHSKSYAWYAKNATGNAADVFTINAKDDLFTYVRLTIIEISGADLTSPLDLTNNGAEVSYSSGSPTLTSSATSNANEIIIGHMANNIGETSVTLDAGYTSQVNDDAGATFIGTKIVSSTGAQTMTNTVSGGNSSYGENMDITSFIAAGGSPPAASVPMRSLLGVGQ